MRKEEDERDEGEGVDLLSMTGDGDVIYARTPGWLMRSATGDLRMIKITRP